MIEKKELTYFGFFDSEKLSVMSDLQGACVVERGDIREAVPRSDGEKKGGLVVGRVLLTKSGGLVL